MSDCKATETGLIYLKTNFLMVEQRGSYLPLATVTPKQGHYASPRLNQAVVPCRMNIEQKQGLFLSHAFYRALNYDNTRNFKNRVIDTSDKEAFIKCILTDRERKETTESADDMIWKNGAYDVNIIDCPNRSDVVIIGDFERLSQAFMVAHMNGGGYVNVDFDPQKMESEITYERPNLDQLRTQTKAKMII